MLRAVTDPAQGAEYRRRLAGRPYFESVLGTRLALFGAHPAAGWRFYLAPGTAALCVRGGAAALCGALPDADAWDEVRALLRFSGVCCLLCAESAPAPLPGWQPAAPLTLWELPQGRALPLPPAPPPDWGLTQTENPPMRPVSALAFAAPDERDAFYSLACTALAHGVGVCRAFAAADGTPVCAVGCYEQSRAEAYLSAGVTAPAWRGRGLASRLIVGLANDLAAARTVRLACEPKLNNMYKRIGFIQIGEIKRYRTKENPV